MQKELIDTQFLRAVQSMYLSVLMILEVRPKIKKNQYCFRRNLFNIFNMLRGR